MVMQPILDRPYDPERGGVTEAAVERGEPILINDMGSWRGAGALRARLALTLDDVQADAAWAWYRMSSFISCPVRTAGGRTLGVLALSSSPPRPPLNEEHLRVTEVFAGLAALALERSELLEREARRSRDEQLLHGAAQRMTASLDLDAVYRLIVEQAALVAAAPTALLLRLDDVTQTLRAVAEVGATDRISRHHYTRRRGHGRPRRTDRRGVPQPLRGSPPLPAVGRRRGRRLVRPRPDRPRPAALRRADGQPPRAGRARRAHARAAAVAQPAGGRRDRKRARVPARAAHRGRPDARLHPRRPVRAATTSSSASSTSRSATRSRAATSSASGGCAAARSRCSSATSAARASRSRPSARWCASSSRRARGTPTARRRSCSRPTRSCASACRDRSRSSPPSSRSSTAPSCATRTPAMSRRSSSARTASPRELPTTGLPLGVEGDTCFEQRELAFGPDELLFASTDGLTEARRERRAARPGARQRARRRARRRRPQPAGARRARLRASAAMGAAARRRRRADRAAPAPAPAMSAIELRDEAVDGAPSRALFAEYMALVARAPRGLQPDRARVRLRRRVRRRGRRVAPRLRGRTARRPAAGCARSRPASARSSACS